MSFASMQRAAQDGDLMNRVTAAAQKEILYNEDLAATLFGQELRRGYGNVSPLMWPVAVDTEAPYEAALLAGRGAPGHDSDVITDAQITSAVIAHWPYAPGETPPTPE